MAIREHWATRRDSDDGGDGGGNDDDAPVYVERYDRGTLSKSPHRMAHGTMLFTARIAKPGILTYVDIHGRKRRELLLAEDLHHVDSLATLGRAAVTLEHPDDDVTPENFKELGVGDVGDRVSTEGAGGFVTVDLAVRRQDALDAIARGVDEVSPGYKVRIEETPGTHPVFGAYDAIQRERLYNHVAITSAARGGRDIRLRTDGAAYQIALDSDDPTPREHMKPQLVQLLALLGVTDVASEEAALTTATRRLDSVQTFLNTLTPEAARLDDVAALQKTLDKMKATADQEGETAKEELLARLKKSEDALAEVTGERDVLKKASDQAKADQQKKTDAEELKRLDSFVATAKIEVDRRDSMTLPEYRKAIVVAVNGKLPEGLPEASVEAYVNGSLNAAITARVDALGGDRANPWASFNFDDPAKKRRADSKPEPKPEDEAVTPTEAWNSRADDAFEAAKKAAPQGAN